MATFYQEIGRVGVVICGPARGLAKQAAGRLLRLSLLLLIIISLSYPPVATAQQISAYDGAAREIGASFDWYRYQGEWDSGPNNRDNCRVTAVAMAIQFSQNNVWVSIREIRDYLQHGGPTSIFDAQKDLSHWGIRYKGLDTIHDVLESVRRGHIVIVGMVMGDISEGPDYLVAYSDPGQRYDRYYSYSGGHAIVVKGVSADGQWLTVYDPNVWDGNGIYWYSDGTPKGKDRYYRTAEVATAMRHMGESPAALEILDVPPSLSPAVAETKSPSLAGGGSSQEQAPAQLKQSSDLTVWLSGGAGWRSVIFCFSVTNPGAQSLHLRNIGVVGWRPTGREFVVWQRNVIVHPGWNEYLALPLSINDPGKWLIKGIRYQVEDKWYELAADGHQQSIPFFVAQD
ncbi:MAG: C39 family peptidase [Chloroflexi bacterium]|nr:C39 family peptidase [Chloroflexota bacterium]MCL5074813.1 C39 family peptidase [Chloroflexota bacterium]